MTIPGFQDYMRPILDIVSRTDAQKLSDIYELTSKYFALSDEDLAEYLPSGSMKTHVNRVQWACTFLAQAGLLTRPSRAMYSITERGRQALASGASINIQYLNRFPEFVEFRSRGKSPQSAGQGAVTGSTEVTPQLVTSTPEELVREAYTAYRELLEHDLLERVKSMSPSVFETLVINLLVAMGYGGSFPEAAKSVGRTGDGGIDGVINEDRLGLDVLYVQAKRWNSPVGARDVRDFSGSLDERKALKGVFITTSSFTKDALNHVEKTAKKIVLIDGFRLARLMVDFNIGVSNLDSFSIKKIDEDYFSGE